MRIMPASALAQGMGIKGLLYSQPGAGKTPLMLTASGALACVCEPGLMSIRKSSFPCVPAFTHTEFREFVLWMCRSREARQYFVFFIDSISQACDRFLEQAKKENSHGKKAYGVLFDEIMPLMNEIYYTPNVNVMMYAKQDFVEVDGTNVFRPMFPGQALPIAVPHLFDEILRLEVQPGGVRMIRTSASYNAVARDRSGNLLELEQPNFDAIFRKILA